MTDTPKPSDPHGLIGNNWPAQSENSYSDAHTTLTTASSTLDEASSSTGQRASSTREQFHGQTGSSVSDNLDSKHTKMSEAATDLRDKATVVFDTEQKISAAKKNISLLTTSGTQQIDATLEAERTGADLPYKKSSSALISDFQQRISSEKTTLDGDLSSATSKLNGQSSSKESDYTTTKNDNHTNSNTTPTGWKQKMEERSGVNFDQPGVPPHPQMPQVSQSTPLDNDSSAHSASPGVSPAAMATTSPLASASPTSASPMGATPNVSPTAMAGSGKPTSDSPRSSAPSRDNGASAQPAPSSTLERLLNSPPTGGPPPTHGGPLGGPMGGGDHHGPQHDGPQAMGREQKVVVPGLSPLVAGGLSNLTDIAGNALDTASSTAGAVAPAAAHYGTGHGGLPQAVAPSVPPSTGQTPGVPGGPPPSGLSPVGPGTAPPPVQTATPNPAFTPGSPAATPGVNVPGPGSQAPVPSAAPAQAPAASPSAAPQGAPPHGQAGAQHSSSPGHAASDSPTASPLALAALGSVGAGAALLHGKTGEDLDAALEALPPEAYGAHCVLASLAQSFSHTGWPGPLAVAALSDGDGQRWYAYATVDGLSVHPNGLPLPANTIPLSQVPGVRAASELMGSHDLHAKLSLLREAGYFPLTGVSTWVRSDQQVADPTFHYQEATVRNRIVENGLDIPVMSPLVGDVDAPTVASVVLNTRSLPIPPADKVAETLRSQRWSGTQPEGYGNIMLVFLVSQTYDALAEGRYAEASVNAAETLRIDRSRPTVVG